MSFGGYQDSAFAFDGVCPVIGDFIGTPIGAPLVASEELVRVVVDTVTYMQEPVDFELADDPRTKALVGMRRSPLGPVPLMKGIFGER